MELEELKNFIVHCLEEKKAENIVIVPLSNKVQIARYMIFATGRSVKNVSAMADYLSLELKHKAKYNVGIDGLNSGSGWVLIDVFDIIVHVFCAEERERLQLESLWHERNKELDSND